MEKNNALSHISKQLISLNEKINNLQSSGKIIPEKGFALVEAQLKIVSQTLDILEEAIEKNETVANAEETIPIDIKEVVGMSLENTAPQVLEKEEPKPVTKKTTSNKKEENPDNSLVGKMKRKPLKDLRTAIGINEKFAFIKLFGGDATACSNALQKLNSFSSYWEAEAMLSEFNKKYNWKEEDETLQTLMELVERRYL